MLTLLYAVICCLSALCFVVFPVRYRRRADRRSSAASPGISHTSQGRAHSRPSPASNKGRSNRGLWRIRPQAPPGGSRAGRRQRRRRTRRTATPEVESSLHRDSPSPPGGSQRVRDARISPCVALGAALLSSSCQAIPDVRLKKCLQVPTTPRHLVYPPLHLSSADRRAASGRIPGGQGLRCPQHIEAP